MLLIPAIDIRNGQCVRLLQGDPDLQIDYDPSPVRIARNFSSAGAEKIHVIDLDGAIKGKSSNQEVVQQILGEVSLEIELGGGIRDLNRIEFWLEVGVAQVILGTVAVTEPDLVEQAIRIFGSDHIIVGVDARDGKVATHGWQSVSVVSDDRFARQMEERGVVRFIYTAIETDGMLSGPNLEALRRFAGSTDAAVTASGGIRNMKDLLTLESENIPGIDSVIVGRAIYEKQIDVQKAIRMLTGDE